MARSGILFGAPLHPPVRCCGVRPCIVGVQRLVGVILGLISFLRLQGCGRLWLV